MAHVSEIQIAVTDDGLESLVDTIIDGTALNISTFRICDLGDTTWYNNNKDFKSLDPDSYYFDFSAAQFNLDRGTNIINMYSYGIGDVDGFINIDSIIKVDPITIEMECYLPPATGYNFTCNEIMLYTGTVGNYKSFIYGIYPEITKIDKYGINFRVIIQF